MCDKVTKVSGNNTDWLVSPAMHRTMVDKQQVVQEMKEAIMLATNPPVRQCIFIFFFLCPKRNHKAISSDTAFLALPKQWDSLYNRP